MLSDSQNVAIIPSKGNIIMKRNRSFQFDGKIIGGLFVFFGKNFFFNYDKFKINLQHIDSIAINVVSDEKDESGRAIVKSVKNLMENAKGELFIDEPNNKSGVNIIQGIQYSIAMNSVTYITIHMKFRMEYMYATNFILK